MKYAFFSTKDSDWKLNPDEMCIGEHEAPSLEGAWRALADVIGKSEKEKSAFLNYARTDGNLICLPIIESLIHHQYKDFESIIEAWSLEELLLLSNQSLEVRASVDEAMSIGNSLTRSNRQRAYKIFNLLDSINRSDNRFWYLDKVCKNFDQVYRNASIYWLTEGWLKGWFESKSYVNYALLFAEKAVEQNSTNGDHYILRGICFEHLERREDAWRSFENAQNYGANQCETNYWWGISLKREKTQMRLALEKLETALRLCPDNGEMVSDLPFQVFYGDCRRALFSELFFLSHNMGHHESVLHYYRAWVTVGPYSHFRGLNEYYLNSLCSLRRFEEAASPEILTELDVELKHSGISKLLEETFPFVIFALVMLNRIDEAKELRFRIKVGDTRSLVDFLRRVKRKIYYDIMDERQRLSVKLPYFL